MQVRLKKGTSCIQTRAKSASCSAVFPTSSTLTCENSFDKEAKAFDTFNNECKRSSVACELQPKKENNSEIQTSSFVAYPQASKALQSQKTPLVRCGPILGEKQHHNGKVKLPTTKKNERLCFLKIAFGQVIDRPKGASTHRRTIWL